MKKSQLSLFTWLLFLLAVLIGMIMVNPVLSESPVNSNGAIERENYSDFLDIVSISEIGLLLLSEVKISPTEGEFIEIYNPNSVSVDLSNVYLTDATYAPVSQYYYNIVTGANYGGGGFTDFHARFPDGATINAREYQTIAVNGSSNFLAEYGTAPTYELYDDGSDDGEAIMREAKVGSIPSVINLSNEGEVVILYYWDGLSDLVIDLDYFLWGDKAEAVDKTGVAIDGPDVGTDTTTYNNDTAIASQAVAISLIIRENSWQRAFLHEGNETKTGGNGAEGHDETSEDLHKTWREAKPTPNAPSVGAASLTGSLYELLLQ